MTNHASTSKTISIIGAGPGGLFLAILLRQQRPDWTLRVWERNPPGATFGFGVVFSDRTVELLDRADPASLATIRSDFQSWTDIEIGTANGVRRTSGHGFSAIARHRLLEILQQRAQELGVDVSYECEAPDLDQLHSESDLIVGADGINSQVRAHWEQEFRPDIRMGQSRFIWFATPRRYDALTFHFVETEYGPFSTHAYPFSKELSTFIVEADEVTWRRAGLDRLGLPDLGVGETDEEAMRLCQEIFADSLHGQPLVGNASYWRQFPTVRNGSWTAADKVVILGDAAHTAHFSVGSGTKMAMEDAVALANALIAEDDPRAALGAYEDARKPAVQKIQQLAEPSRGWWENFQWWVDRDVDRFSINFLTRTGRETLDQLDKRDARFASQAVDATLLDRDMRLAEGLVLANRQAVLLSPDATTQERELAAIKSSGAWPGLLILPDATREHVARVREAFPEGGPPIAAEPATADVDVTILPAGSPPIQTPFAVRLTTPETIDDVAGWLDLVAAAQEAEARGAILVIFSAPEGSLEHRALRTHAGVVVRPRVLIPIALADCSSEQEALTHLNADRADLVFGTINARYFPALHDQVGLESLLDPQGIVVVGASQDETKAGNALLRNLRAFPGPVYGLGRNAGRAHDRSIVTDLSDIEDPVDLAVLAVPSQAVPRAIEDLALAGTKAAIICSGGFAETGSPEGLALQDSLDRLRRRFGVRVLGPNTSGLAVPGLELHASFVPAVTEISPGSVAVLAQSGGVAHATALALGAEGIGVAVMVGTGNACDVDLPELIRRMASSQRCAAIAVHVEGTSDGMTLLQAIRQASVTTPVIVLKSGVSDVDRLAQSHTGSLTGDWTVAQAVLTEAGAVVVSTLGDLVDAASVLSLARLDASLGGSTVAAGVVTGQAGPGILLTDRLQTLGVRVPELTPETEARLQDLLPALTHRQNPVDTGRPTEVFADVLTTVARDSLIDLVALYVLLEPDALDLVATLKQASDRSPTPIVASSNGVMTELLPIRDELRSSGIPLLVNPERAAVGAWALAADKRATVQRAARGCVSQPTHRRDFGSAPTTESQAKALLREAGIHVPPSQLCADRSQAHEAMAVLLREADSVVVKLSSSEVPHKSAAGGVHLGITQAAHLDRALDAIDRIERADSGYLIESQADDGPDLFVAVRHDPTWGAVGLLGLGGSDVEERGEIELFALPTTAAVIQQRLVDLFPSTSIHAASLVHIYEVLDQALTCWPDLSTFEINPLRILPSGAVALDALVTGD